MLLIDVLLSFVDAGVSAFEIFDATNLYRKPIKDYRKWREDNKIEAKKLYRLKTMGYLDHDERNYFLTKKAIKRIRKIALEDIKLKNPKTWDEKWRIVIFDIPEEYKKAREVFRRTLVRLGFIQIQKSAYCYPHDCIEEITYFLDTYEIKPYVTYLEVSNIITGINIVEEFQSKGIL